MIALDDIARIEATVISRRLSIEGRCGEIKDVDDIERITREVVHALSERAPAGALDRLRFLAGPLAESIEQQSKAATARALALALLAVELRKAVGLAL